MTLNELISQYEKSELHDSKAFSLIEKLIKNKKELELMVDNAHNALSAVSASGEINSDAVFQIINDGLDNKSCTVKGI